LTVRDAAAEGVADIEMLSGIDRLVFRGFDYS
jgi:hypothetical protein